MRVRKLIQAKDGNMKVQSKNFIGCLLIILSNGCAGSADTTLSPPSDTKWVNVEIKNPSHWK